MIVSLHCLTDRANGWNQFCAPTVTQLGAGVKNDATEKAHLVIGAALDVAAWRKSSVAALFIDVVGAFAALQRAVVLDDPESDEHLAGKLRSPRFASVEMTNMTADLAFWYAAGGSHCKLL